MDYERIVNDVRHELALGHRAEAERAVAEFLAILGELLDPRAEVTLMSRLPLEMRAVLGPDDVEVFELETFIERLSDQLQLDERVAEQIVRAAARAFGAELDAPALAELARCLPPTVMDLFREHAEASAAPPG